MGYGVSLFLAVTGFACLVGLGGSMTAVTRNRVYPSIDAMSGQVVARVRHASVRTGLILG